MTIEDFKIKVVPVSDKLFRFANRILSNREEAQDIVQEVLLKLWTMREKLNEYNSIEGLAMTIARNKSLDRLKALQIRRTTDDHPEAEYSQPDPAEKMQIDETVKYVEKVIGSLPHPQNMVIQLRDVEGFSFEEISEMMEMTVNNIRVSLSRARKTVRDELIKSHSYE